MAGGGALYNFPLGKQTLTHQHERRYLALAELLLIQEGILVYFSGNAMQCCGRGLNSSFYFK